MTSTTGNLHNTDILTNYPTTSPLDLHKSDDSLNGIVFAILCKLTIHKLANTMEKTEYKTLENF